MADISKIKLNDITYVLKDAEARAAIASITNPLVFKGTIGSASQGSGTESEIPTTNVSVGDTYLIVDEARTLAAQYSATGADVLLDIGDTIIGVSSNPVKYAAASAKDEMGVTSVATGTGLSGGPITTSGTISVDFTSVQEKLTSGTNIKTINNTSLLGSGNIDIQAGGTVDTAMSDSSENAVQNKVIKAYVDSVILSTTDDGNGVVTLSVSPSSLLNADTTGY